MSLNEGHRQRVKNRFLAEGLDAFEEVHVLELLLFYCIPRSDTKLLAKELIAHFGSLAQVLEATPEELQKIKGIKEHTATFLNLITAVSRYYQVHRRSQITVLNTIEKCGQYLLPYFIGRPNETVFLLCLDAKCKVLCCREVGTGSVNSAGVSVRKIVETALGVKATTVILSHNHPSGLALPSGDDVLTTRRIAAALQAVEIILADHIVVADEDYVSLIQSGLYHVGDAE